MLRELSIRNFALIEQLELSFYSGFSVLTGETGAGKSIIIDALGLLLGRRASTEMIRTGAESCVIQGVFAVHDEEALGLLQEWGIDAEEELVITREVSNNGRNRCRLNGKLVSVSQLSELGAYLAEIVGQHDSRSLLNPNRHLMYLDAFGGDAHQRELDELRARHEAWSSIRREMTLLSGDERERNRRIDLLRFQLEEIADARLQTGEEEALLAERKRLANLDRLRKAVGTAYGLLSDSDGHTESVVRKLNLAQAELERARAFDDELAAATELLASAVAQVGEVSLELWSYLDRFELDPERLNEVETRLDLIETLKRKYGDSVAEILKFADQAQQELEFLESSAERSQELQKELEHAWSAWLEKARQVSLKRRELAAELEKKIEGQLADLNMSNTRFVVSFEDNGAQERMVPNHDGLEQVQFMIAPNVGEELKPLSRIASGGELSRVMLAIKVILAQAEAIPTIVFDEIDTGIGGQTAGKLAEKLKALSAACQVMCVTHLPVIASFGAHHYAVHKETSGERTTISVRELAKDGRIMELTRMLGGSESSDSITAAHAKELLERAGGM